MMSKEMDIWSAAKKTDTAATKENKAGGYKSTTINGYSMIQKATELWGPVGSEWGYEIIEERFDVGGPILDKETKSLICHTLTNTIKLGLYYPGCQKQIIQYGHTPYVYDSKYGPITDAEASKKSLMDALKKSLSMLGFSADVFLGEFDDDNYIEELKNDEALKKAEDKDVEKERQRVEYVDWIDASLTLLNNASSLSELEGIFTLCYRKMMRRKDEANIKKFTLAKDKVKKALESK